MKKLNIRKRIHDSAVMTPANSVEAIMPYEKICNFANEEIGIGRPGFLGIVVTNGKVSSISSIRDNENPDFREMNRWFATEVLTNSGDGLIVAQNTKYRLPTQKQIENTSKLADALAMLGIRLIDNVLVPQAEDGYFSFVENEILK